MADVKSTKFVLWINRIFSSNHMHLLNTGSCGIEWKALMAFRF